VPKARLNFPGALTGGVDAPPPVCCAA